MPKRVTPEERRRPITARIAPDSFRRIDLLRERWGIESDGQVIDRALEEAAKERDQG